MKSRRIRPLNSSNCSLRCFTWGRSTAKTSTKNSRLKLWIKICQWHEERTALAAVRQQVFIDEQGFAPEDEWDPEGDPVCLHFLISQANGEPVRTEDAIATARLAKDGRISRVSVLAPYRRRGIGHSLMKEVIQQARQTRQTEVYLSSQVDVMPFYEQLGFEAYGEIYLDGPIMHQNMRLKL
ncbi:GNAT family N-acetyltransferase [Spongorhabdus nitratireducens]